ncbi:pyridoxal phosphate-dependent aminotransferase [Aspergillus homomorphus CBS 101889]|uniref:Putative kynurenine aminotransferase n=1 Tax=Aspergillus homomorphus (strain CBS 101889) TaxID=1450537 RepID=A0A395HTS1_ASPHC|nr:putative kynurenine aminotransferase [Aspergillus homomorphus CBS 101889]RAL10946.1 putative kynurenine aminotransferase [Aspergillus homomorphus CBS 101889]
MPETAKKAQIEAHEWDSDHVEDVWSFVNEAAAASPIQPIANLGQGFFGYNPPRFAIDAAKDALDRVDCNQCAPTKGRPRLKSVLADMYSRSLGRDINPDTEVVVTSGANEGMLCAFMGLLSPGDEAIVFEPFFDQFISSIELAGAIVRYVSLLPPENRTTWTSRASDWAVDFPRLENLINDRTKMIVCRLCHTGLNLHNPTGKVFTHDEINKIGAICIQHNLILLSDEVYDRLAYQPSTSPASLTDDLYRRTLTVGSAGKALHATGWRVGYLVGPAPLIARVATVHTKICYSTASPLQESVAVAYEHAEKTQFWQESRRLMQDKIRCFCKVWDELGLPYTLPDGGYFVLVNMSAVRIPADYPFPSHIVNRRRDFRLCWFIIQELGVAAIPPSVFYSPENASIGEKYLRFAVCKEEALLELAKTRLRGLKKYIPEHIWPKPDMSEKKTRLVT